MKIVITGATSFIGSEFTRLASEKENEIFAVCRKASANIERIMHIPSVNIIYADMDEYGDLHQIIEHADIFVNFAWEGTGHGGRDDVEVQRRNVNNSVNATYAAEKMGCKLFVEAGSQAEYGSVCEKITEEMECKPFSEYGKAKLEVKDCGFKIADNNIMKYMHLRIFSLFGEGDHPWTLVMSSLNKMKNNEPISLSSCEQKWNFLHVADAALQIYLLCCKMIANNEWKHEIFNIASEDTRPLKQFVYKMKELVGSESTLNFGAISTLNIVSLDPDTSKVKNAIGFIANHKFEEDIINIYQSL